MATVEDGFKGIVLQKLTFQSFFHSPLCSRIIFQSNFMSCFNPGSNQSILPKLLRANMNAAPGWETTADILAKTIWFLPSMFWDKLDCQVFQTPHKQYGDISWSASFICRRLSAGPLKGFCHQSPHWHSGDRRKEAKNSFCGRTVPLTRQNANPPLVFVMSHFRHLCLCELPYFGTSWLHDINKPCSLNRNKKGLRKLDHIFLQ